MKQNWSTPITEKEFINFINHQLLEGYYILDEARVNGKQCERYSDDYGKYFEVTIDSYYMDEDGTPHDEFIDLRLGQFGSLDAIPNADGCTISVADNFANLESLNQYSVRDIIVINWIKYLAQRNAGRTNSRGQSYFEDLTSRISRRVMSKKLWLERQKERELQEFEKPYMRTLGLLGSSAPYSPMSRLNDAHKQLINFNLEEQRAVYEENSDEFFS